MAQLTSVVDIRNAGDGSNRLFAVQQPGRVLILRDGAVAGTPFLDIRGRVGSGGERGLLSIAFAPDYASSGFFYVFYTDLSGDTVLSRFRVSADPDVADAGSEQILLAVEQPFSNHNGGRLAFGPDGMLYLGLGDGGSANDPLNNSQSGDTLLGKVIRIDVNPIVGTYLVPADNPFVADGAVLNEIWALGLRNPWRMSFDPLTGDLFIADVGQGAREEVNFQPAASGGGENYGWRIMEGSQCASDPNCDPAPFTLPVSEYTHAMGCSVTGGEMYRGSVYPELQGVYLYGDYCSGRIWGLQHSGNAWVSTQLADTAFVITTFGVDEAGNIYLFANGDGIYLVSDGPPEVFRINAGLNDAWVNFSTLGQGFFINVFPVIGKVFLAMFTYDTERPDASVIAQLGGPGQRWFSAFGDYADDEAVLVIEKTTGGLFNSGLPMPDQVADGTLILRFSSCNSGTVTFDIVSADVQGVIPIVRATGDNIELCEMLATQ